MSAGDLETLPAADAPIASASAAASAEPVAPSPGLVLANRYRLVRPLGRGGMGEVWEATHVALGHSIAVKTLRASAGLDDGARAARFLQEAKVAAGLRHPGVVRVTDFGNERGVLWFAMELVGGETLEALLEREAPLSPARALALMGPLFEAVEWLHAQGVVHRDIKPANVILERVAGRTEPSPKLLDFGIARSVELVSDLTATGDLLGTPRYMAPEQARGDRDVGPGADQYALALLLYEAVSGAAPHEGEGLALLHARAQQPAADVASRRPELRGPFSDALMKALAPAPRDRHGSVDALSLALSASLTPTPAARPARRRWTAAVAAAALLAALAAAMWPAPTSTRDASSVRTRADALIARPATLDGPSAAPPTRAAPALDASTNATAPAPPAPVEPPRPATPIATPRRPARALPIDRVYRETRSQEARRE
ncbi:MAG: serine/threonine-protein kinase [Polyangiales bacterium]